MPSKNLCVNRCPQPRPLSKREIRLIFTPQNAVVIPQMI
tara:strand:+ start:10378 stop:10494 length:117 start_codon:yes stop_codon:yes gene_type:complete